MNTPTAEIPDPPHAAELFASVLNEGVSRRLEEVVKSREQATPEPQTPPDEEESYHEELLNHFKPHEADRHRMRISQPSYWETECFQYDRALKELMLQKSHATHDVDGWRALGMTYRGLLKHAGLSLSQVRDTRHSIKSQEYWQHEAEVYHQHAMLQEEQMRKALLKRDKVQRTRRQPAQPPIIKINHLHSDGGIASRTRSRTKPCTGRVAKRGCKAGAAAARRLC